MARLKSLLAVAILLATACSLAPADLLSRRPAPAASPSRPVDEILDRRGRAVLEGSEAGFLADLDPSRAGLVDRERMVFANLRQLQPAEFRYQRQEPDRELHLELDGPLYVAVVLTVAFRDVDAASTAVPYRFTFQRRGSRLAVTDVQATAWAGLRHSAPWEQVRLGVVRAGGLVVAADPTVRDTGRLAATAAAAAERVRRLWGSRARPAGFLVFLTADRQQFLHWLDTFATSEPTGAMIPLPAAGASGTPTGQLAGAYVLVDLSSVGAEELERVLRHELVHAVSVRVQHSRAPVWALEGFARWVEVADAPNLQRSQVAVAGRAVSAGRYDGQLPPPERSFYDEPELNYALAYTVFRFVGERWSAEQVVDFYVRAIAQPELDAAATGPLGVSPETFLREWQAYVRRLRA